MKSTKLFTAVAIVATAFSATTVPAYAGSTWETVDVSSSPFEDTLADGTIVTVTFGPGGGHWGTTFSPALYQTDAAGGVQTSWTRFTFSQPVTMLKTFYAFLGPGDEETFTTDQGAVNLTQTVANGGNILTSSGDFVSGQVEGSYSAGGMVSAPPLTLDRSGTLELQFSTGINWIEMRGMPQGGGGPGINLIGLQLTMSTVAFDANGGDGAMSDQTKASVTDLNPNTFTRDGYTFEGWNTAFDGSGTAYGDGDPYPFAIDETLFAQWLAIPTDPTDPSPVADLPATGVDLVGPAGLGTVLLVAGSILVRRRRA